MSTQSDLAEAAKCFCFNDATARAVVVYILLSKTGLLAMTPSELAIAAKNYSYDLDTWKKTVAYLLAVEAGLQGQTPSQLADASKCFCFNDGTWKKVVAYLLNAGGTGSCPQDMQVAWTPSNLKLGEQMAFGPGTNPMTGATTVTFQGASVGSLKVTGAPNLISISAPNITHIDPNDVQLEGGLIVVGNTLLTTLSLPLLIDVGAGQVFQIFSNPVLTTVSLPSFVAKFSDMEVHDNPLLTSFSAPVWIPPDGSLGDFRNDALNAASVNGILARFVASPTWGTTGEQLLLQGGTNAAPSGQGIADKATLIGRGATVTTN